jgi:CO/xanthine dehydrogenase Mo-binding subunit
MRLLARPINLSAGIVNGLKARLFPYGVDSSVPRTSGSRGMFMLGRASLDAAERFRQSALSLAAQMLKVPSAELEVGAMGVQHRADASRRIAWAALAAHAGGTLAALGEAHLPPGVLLNPATGNQVGAVDHMQASHGCDVAVHRDTGEVRILRYVACHDVGRALDPIAIRGQILGGIAMGVGQALWEHIVVERGQVQTVGLHEYLVPTALDVPRDVKIEILESGGGLGPDGAKGVGEAAAVAAPIAVANALYDALGVQLTCIPATPEDIVNAWLSAGKS